MLVLALGLVRPLKAREAAADVLAHFLHDCGFFVLGSGLALAVTATAIVLLKLPKTYLRRAGILAEGTSKSCAKWLVRELLR